MERRRCIGRRRRGHLKAVALLLDRGAKVDAMDGEGVTPLILASYRGQTEVVKLLLERGADVNAREKRNGLSSLSHAVGRGDKELVKVLLAHGADPLLKSVDGRTALERAEANGDKEIVALLKGAQGRSKSKWGPRLSRGRRISRLLGLGAGFAHDLGPLRDFVAHVVGGVFERGGGGLEGEGVEALLDVGALDGAQDGVVQLLRDLGRRAAGTKRPTQV